MKISEVNDISICNIHGKKTTVATMTPIILGMKVSVISCMEVTAWNMLTATPMIRPKPSMGAETKIVISRDFFAISTMYSGVILIPFRQPKLFTSEPTIRYQPSTSTKSISLNGIEIITGGNIIMPMLISTEAITMSTTRKGM